MKPHPPANQTYPTSSWLSLIWHHTHQPTRLTPEVADAISLDLMKEDCWRSCSTELQTSNRLEDLVLKDHNLSNSLMTGTNCVFMASNTLVTSFSHSTYIALHWDWMTVDYRHTHTHTHTYIALHWDWMTVDYRHTHTHTHTHIYSFTLRLNDSRLQTYTHTYILTYITYCIHTYIHTICELLDRF